MIARNSQMTQIFNDYTRITNVSKSKIDLIFVSRPEQVVTSGVHSLGLRDHSLVYVVHKHKQIKQSPRIVKSRCFKNFNDNDFIDSIDDIDWSQTYCIDDVNAALDKWQSLFTDTHAPLKEKRIKGHMPEWVNRSIMSSSSCLKIEITMLKLIRLIK